MPHPLDPSDRTIVASQHLSLYPGEMHPAGCELCDCKHYRWDGDPYTRMDACRCEHLCMRHVFRKFDPADEACCAY